MNRRQKIGVWVAVMVIAVMCIYPPLRGTSIGSSSPFFVGYHPIWMEFYTFTNQYGVNLDFIDLTRLTVQIFVVLLIGCAWIITNGSSKQ